MSCTTMGYSHVFECDNETNDNRYNLDKNRGKKVSNIRRIRKALKPLYNLLRNKRKNRSKKIEKCCPCEDAKSLETVLDDPWEDFTQDLIEDQNSCNDAVEQKLSADFEADFEAALTVCLDGQLTVVPIVPEYPYVPVHFARTRAGDFFWTTVELCDQDLRCKVREFTQNQVPEMQVPLKETEKVAA